MRPSLERIAAVLLIGCFFAGSAPAHAQDPPAAKPVEDSDGRPLGESTRLLFLPTAQTLEPGHGYVVGHAMLIPSFQIGVTPHFSMGAGSFFKIVSWVTPKVQVYNGRRTSVALAAVHFFAPSFEGDGTFGLAYAAITQRTGNGEWTLGAGQVYSSADDEDWRWSRGGTLVVFGGERRLSSRASFITENLAGLERSHGRLRPSVGLLMAGVRFSGGGRMVWDVAAIISPHRNGFVIAPFGNWAVRF